MRRRAGVTMIGLSMLILGGCDGAPPEPPRAETRPKTLEIHGDERVDEYYWLRERDDPQVVAYLEAENAYTKAMTERIEPLEESLYEEIVGRIKQTDESVPYLEDGYWYYSRYTEGQEYPVVCRKRGTLEADEQVMLDVNELAEGHDYFQLGRWQIATNNRLLAFATDSVGRRKYTIRFKDLDTGEILADEIEDVTGGMAWANDDRTLFYAKQDPDTLRSYRIYRHALGSDPANDALVFEEADETFSAYVFKTKSKRFVMIGSFQTLSSEYRYLDADDPDGEFTVVLPRERDHEYFVDHYGDEFYIRTNRDAKNFRLVKAPVRRPTRWTEVIPHRDDVLLEDIEIFRDFLVIEERREGLMRLRIVPWRGGDEHELDFGEPAYLAFVGINRDFDTSTLRYRYTSMTTPMSTYDYEMKSREKTLLKREEVLGGFDTDDYRTARLWATADDGTKVPISVVHHKDTSLDGTAPTLVYGYGSYGNSLDATFSSSRLSLLDRGFVYAIAHVRGGEELGRAWYEGGKLLNKVNTFTDFNDCAEHLVEAKYADPRRVYAMGGSAGGLLMGAVINLQPELYHGVVAMVPFVDVVTTMLDDSIPLTTSEFDEWGDPKDKTYYEYMLSYSPYDNLEAKAYPNMLVTTGLHDSQVQYWEPAKWVARLRATKTDDNVLLMKTNMDAGHGGASGRYQRYREIAFRYAFILDLAGVGS